MVENVVLLHILEENLQSKMVHNNIWHKKSSEHEENSLNTISLRTELEVGFPNV